MKTLTLREIGTLVEETNYLDGEVNSRDFSRKFDNTWVDWINKLIQQGEIITNLNWSVHGRIKHTPVMQELLAADLRDRYKLAMIDIANFILINPRSIEAPDEFLIENNYVEPSFGSGQEIYLPKEPYFKGN